MFSRGLDEADRCYAFACYDIVSGVWSAISGSNGQHIARVTYLDCSHIPVTRITIIRLKQHSYG
jgi:hypothetical protein